MRFLYSILFLIFTVIASAQQIDHSIQLTFTRQSQPGIIHNAFEAEDGKIIVHGLFDEVNGHATSNVVRLNEDYSVDTSFKSTYSNNTHARFRRLSTKRVIAIYNTRTTVNNFSANIVVFDSSGAHQEFVFDGFGTEIPVPEIYAAASFQDKILLTGYFSKLGGVSVAGAAFLGADGTITPTPSFMGPVDEIFTCSDGSFLMHTRDYATTCKTGPGDNLLKLNNDLTTDASFTTRNVRLIRKILYSDSLVFLKAVYNSTQCSGGTSTSYIISSKSSQTLHTAPGDVVAFHGKTRLLHIGGNTLSRTYIDGSADAEFQMVTLPPNTRIYSLSSGDILGIPGDVLGISGTDVFVIRASLPANPHPPTEIITDIEGHSADAVTIHPNPSSGKITFAAPKSITHYSWRITSAQGEEVLSGDGSGETLVDLSAFASSGIYILSLMEGRSVFAKRRICVVK